MSSVVLFAALLVGSNAEKFLNLQNAEPDGEVHDNVCEITNLGNTCIQKCTPGQPPADTIFHLHGIGDFWGSSVKECKHLLYGHDAHTGLCKSDPGKNWQCIALPYAFPMEFDMYVDDLKKVSPIFPELSPEHIGRLMSWVWRIEGQLRNACQRIKWYMQEYAVTPSTFSIIGASQGGIVSRWIAQNHEIDQCLGTEFELEYFVSVDGPQNGVVWWDFLEDQLHFKNLIEKILDPILERLKLPGIEKALNGWVEKQNLNEILVKLLDRRVADKQKMLDLLRRYLAPAGFWYDPTHTDPTTDKTDFLARLNNVLEGQDQEEMDRQTDALKNLKGMLLLQAGADSTIVPQRSEWFGEVFGPIVTTGPYSSPTWTRQCADNDKGSNGAKQSKSCYKTMQQNQLYENLGLKSLMDPENQILHCSLRPGRNHTQMLAEDYEKIVIPFLLGDVNETQNRADCNSQCVRNSQCDISTEACTLPQDADSLDAFWKGFKTGECKKQPLRAPVFTVV